MAGFIYIKYLTSQPSIESHLISYQPDFVTLLLYEPTIQRQCNFKKA